MSTEARKKIDTLRVAILAQPWVESDGSQAGIHWVATGLEYDVTCQANSLSAVTKQVRKLVAETLALDVHYEEEPFHNHRRDPEAFTLETWKAGVELKRPVSLEPIPKEFRGRDDVPMRAIFRVC